LGDWNFGILSCGWGAKVDTLLIDDGAKTKGLGCAWPVHKQACTSLYYKAFPPKLSSMFSLKCALTRQQYKMCLSESAASSKIAASSACCAFTWNAVVWGWIAVVLQQWLPVAT